MEPTDLPPADSSGATSPTGPVPESVSPDGDSKSRPETRERRKRLGKKLLFSFIVTACVLLLLEGLLAVFGVKPLFYEDPFVGFAAYSPLFEEVTRPDGTTVYQTAPGKRRWFNEQSFPKRKGGDTYRIFCMGGSTTMGRPYDDKTSFSRWLREYLKEADSSRTYEVINAGGVSYASYRVARLMGELVQYEPDLFIIYTGHNEFLERHTYGSMLEIPESVRDLTSLLSRSRIYSFTHRLVNSNANDAARSAEHGPRVLPTEVDAVLDRTLGPETYTREETLRSHVIAHFEHTLVRIVGIARHAGAEVVFVEPASNLRDCRPFKSQHRDGLSQDELNSWNQWTAAGEEARDAGRLNLALTNFDQAARIDDRVAHLHFERARVLWELGRFDEARTAFVRARDEDVCPLRALTQLREIVQKVAREHQVRLVPFATAVEARSAHGVPGADHFLDHVHPTIEGHQMLADLLLEELAAQGAVGLDPSWNQSQRDNLIRRVESTFDRRDHALALRNLAKVLTWSGKFDEADRLALQAVEELTDDYDAHFLAGNAELRRGRHREAIAHFEQTVQINPAHSQAYNNLGNACFQRGELERAAEYFEQSVRADPRFALGFHNLGVVQLESGRDDSAIEFLKQALALEPDRFDSHWLLSKIYYQQQRYTDARRHMQQAVEIRPDDAGARADLKMLTELSE